MLSRPITFFLSFIFHSSAWALASFIEIDFEIESMQRPFYQHLEVDHQVQMLSGGISSLQKRLELIESAEHSIELESFIFTADMAGRALMQALVQKAEQGVRVRVLLDQIYNQFRITPFHVEILRRRGVELAYFNTAVPLQAYKVQFRNHRKLLAIDDRIAIVGGRNVQDKYFDLDRSYNFKDRDFVIEGPIVEVMRESFDYYWYSDFTNRFIEAPSRPNRSDLIYQRSNRSQFHRNNADFQRDLNYWESRMSSAIDFVTPNRQDRALLNFITLHGARQAQLNPSGICREVSFISDVPYVGRKARTRDYRRVSDAFYQAVDQVQERMTFESPYFIFNDDSAQAIQRLLDRGAQFDAITNSLYSTDAIFVSAAFFGGMRQWVGRGLAVHIFNGQSIREHLLNRRSLHARWGIHSKSAVFDDDLLKIGSFNFDPRSKDWNMEMAFFCRSEEMADSLRHSIEKRIAASTRVDNIENLREAEFQNVGPLKQLGYYLLYFPSNWLSFLL